MVVDELNVARKHLEDAMDRYSNACLAAETLTMSDGAWNLLNDHLTSLTSLRQKLDRTWATIGRTMNHCSSPTGRVSALPTEILARIFLLIPVQYRSDPPYRSKSEKNQPLTSFQLEKLMLVCSRWHKTVLSLQQLWTNIDLVWDDFGFSRSLVARAHVSATRAGHLPLNLQVHGLPIHSPDNNTSYAAETLQFLVQHAARIKSLQLTSISGQQQLYQSVLQCVLKGCKPGVFTELVVSSELGSGTPTEAYAGLAIESNESPQGVAGFQIDIPQQQLNEVLLSIKYLRLYNLYPDWTSKLYKGLVELDISGSLTTEIPFTEAEFFNILISCPRLRLLSITILL